MNERFDVSNLDSLKDLLTVKSDSVEITQVAMTEGRGSEKNVMLGGGRAIQKDLGR